MGLTLKNTNALTEKGQLKPAVRATVAAFIASHPEKFAEAEKVEGKNVYVLPVTDADGNVFYVNFDVTVSTKAGFDRAERKSKPKATVAETPEVE